MRDPNLGGTVSFEWGWARWVPAWHTSTTPKGTVSTPAGIVVEIGGKRIYHLGDTALFSDLALPGRRDRLDLALVPIGGHYTMDRFDAVLAAELVGAPQVIPSTTTRSRRSRPTPRRSPPTCQAGAAQVTVLEPGAALELR